MNAHGLQGVTLKGRVKLTAIALVGAVILLLIAIGAFARQTSLLTVELDRQGRLSQWSDELDESLLLLTSAETGQRGYLLIGKSRYLAPYKDAADRFPRLLDRLDELAAAEPATRTGVAEIRRLAGAKLAELADTIQLQRNGQEHAAITLVQTDAGQALMERLRVEINSLDAFLKERQRESAAHLVSAGTTVKWIAVWAGLTLLATLALAAVQIVTLLRAQKRYATALSRSEREHRAIVEEQSELIALCEHDGTLLYTNPSFGRATSAPRAGLKKLFDPIHPDDRAQLRVRLSELICTGQVVESHTRILANGTERWIAWRHRLQEHDGGQRVIHSVGRDITVQITAAENLRASEEFLARTGRVAGVGGWELDLRDHVLRWSEEVKRIHGVASSFQPDLQAALNLYAPGPREELRQAIEGARERGEAWDLELPLVRANGERVFVRVVGEAECDANDKPCRLVVAVQDITERKMLERRIAENEQFVRAITDNVPVRIAYYDRGGRIRFINQALCDRLGKPRDALLGLTLQEITGTTAMTPVTRRLRSALLGRGERFEYSDKVNGVAAQVQVSLIPNVADGAVRGVFAVGVDITHLKSVERSLRELTEVLDNTSDYIAQADWRGQMVYVNPAARRVLGMEQGASLTGRVYSEFFTPETNTRWANEIVPAVQRDGVWIGETAVVVEGGRTVPINHMVIAHRDTLGRIARYSSVMRDISGALAARHELARQTATLSAIIEAIPSVVAVWDAELRYVRVNAAFERWRGCARDRVVGHRIEDVVDEAEYQRSVPWLKRALGGEAVRYEKDYPSAADSRYMAVSYIPLSLESGSTIGVVGIAQDVTHEREENRRLLQLSERDSLTGLLNRAGFEAHLETLDCQGDADSIALIYIDLDRFKPINDTHGHAAGDHVLQEFGNRLKRLVRPSDAVARLGGDEFAIVLGGIREASNATAVAEKVVQAAARPIPFGEQVLTIGASVGVALGAASSRWTELVKRADAMVYRVKGAGRGGWLLEEASSREPSIGMRQEQCG